MNRLKNGMNGGKGYYGEYLVFRELFTKLDGTEKFLMNLQIPTKNGKTTEVDLVMIHDTGIYVFEIKHYKGRIYGDMDGQKWTQYFRTAANHTFNNPVLQNAYHINAIKQQIPQNIPVYSVVVFTNDFCDIRVEKTRTDVLVTPLWKLNDQLKTKLQDNPRSMCMEGIDDLFKKLMVFSPIREKTVSVGAEEAVPFYDYIHTLRDRLMEERKQETEEKRQAIEKANKKVLWTRIFCAVLVVALLGGVVTIALTRVDHIKEDYDHQLAEYMAEYDQKMQAMEKKFQKVDVSMRDDTFLLNSMVQKHNVVLQQIENMKDTATFACDLVNTDQEYGFILNEDSKYIVMLRDGTIQEYDMFGNRLKYQRLSNTISGLSDKMSYNHTESLVPLEIYGVQNIDDIAYIKITNVSLWKLYTNNNKPLVDGLELEVYSAD